MLRSIQWKLVIMFVLLVISVMIVVGTILLYSITDFYHQQFIRQMDNFFESEEYLPVELTADSVAEKLRVFVVQLGIDSYRDYYVLNELGVVIRASRQFSTHIESTPNIISAINGKVGREYNRSASYVDYAVPIFTEGMEGEVKYIIYIQDTKEELYQQTAQVSNNIFYALFIGLIISVVLGFLLSNTITAPIAILTRKAENLAAGNFEQIAEIKAKDEIGKLAGTFNFMAKELQQYVKEIGSEKNKMEAILLHMTDGVLAFNAQGKLIHMNLAAEKMLGLVQSEIQHFDTLFASTTADITLVALIEISNKKAVKKQIDINELHINAFFIPFQLENETEVGMMVVLQDITEQQKLEMVRREFVANVSHELKTPLTSIKSYAETLLQGLVDDKETTTHFLEVINNEADRMTRLVRDLLVLSQLDYKQTQWKKQSFCLVGLVEEVLEKLLLTAQRRKQQLAFHKKVSEVGIYGDRDKIEQVLVNVISNAIKYTPQEGEIHIYVDVIGECVQIKVIDNGMGIPQQDLARIFERFYRVDKARSRELGGTGLGLSIAREIVAAHKGSITMKSELNEGTKVVIQLPVQETKKME